MNKNWQPLTTQGWASFDELADLCGYVGPNGARSVYALIFGRGRVNPVSRIRLSDIRKIGYVHVVRLAMLDNLRSPTVTYPHFTKDEVCSFKEYTNGFWSVTEFADEVGVAKQRAFQYLNEGRIPDRYIFTIDGGTRLAIAARGVREFVAAHERVREELAFSPRAEARRTVAARGQAVRAWAQGKGYQLANKGPIPQWVSDEYDAEQAAKVADGQVTRSGAGA